MIVDQLVRISGRDRAHTVLWEGRGKLRALNCHILYTAPFEFANSRARPRLETEYGELLEMPPVPVTATDRSIRDGAIAVMRKMAVARMRACGGELCECIGSEALMEEVIHASGGHLRTLFLLLTASLDRSDALPLAYEQIHGAITALATGIVDPLDTPQCEVLLQVHKTKRRPDSELHLDYFNGLLSDQYVFAYAAAGTRWYDWNPLLEHSSLGGRR